MRIKFFLPFAAVFLAVSLGAAGAQAAGGSASDLLTDCMSKDPYKRGFCTGYVAGTDHMFSTLAARKKISRQYCPGQEATLGELKSAWKKWMAKHPDRLDAAADVSLVVAWRETYPCAKK